MILIFIIYKSNSDWIVNSMAIWNESEICVGCNCTGEDNDHCSELAKLDNKDIIKHCMWCNPNSEKNLKDKIERKRRIDRGWEKGDICDGCGCGDISEGECCEDGIHCSDCNPNSKKNIKERIKKNKIHQSDYEFQKAYFITGDYHVNGCY